MEANTEYENYKKRIEKFPCAFNLVGAERVTTAKLRAIQHNLTSDLDINDNCENERIIKLNLLTWVRFRLEKQDEAVQLSNEAVDSTERRNIASLGNRFFVMWQTGDEFEATKCLKDLEKMESEQAFDTRLTDAQAEQAYYYSRLGGPINLQRAIDIHSDLPESSINYLRKFGRGLVYCRATHANIYCSSSEPMTVHDYQQRAAECLFDVADNANSRLRSLAYAQLVNLRHSYRFDLPPEDQVLFRGLGVMQLCEKALEHGEDIPSVLAQCGKAIKSINIDKAIEWLKKAVEIKDNSTAYHHLGLCYKRKAEEAAKGNPCPQNTSEGLRDHYCMGQQEAESQVTGQSHDMSRTSRNEHNCPADGSTQYHQANNAAINVMGEYSQANCDPTRHLRFNCGSNNNCDERSHFSDRTWKLQTSLKGFARRFKNESLLEKDDMYVQEALKCFKMAIDIAKGNLPAALDLGLLFKETNQVEEALKQFNSITNNHNPLTDHRMTVISAYEQAGICCLQLSQIERNDYQEMAKNKLTKAVSMAADLALIMPELQGSHKEVWVAFTTLLAEIDKAQKPHNSQIKEKIKVLELAREYGDIVDVIQKLKDTEYEEINNPDIIKTALDSYLKLGQPDNALGYHNLVSMNPAVKGSDWWNANPMQNLRVKVLLHAISKRLKEISDSPTDLFQQLFELVFGSCVGLHHPENDHQNDTAPLVLGDVLLVFDTDDSPDEEIRCPAVKAARCLRTLSTCLFGLETQENLKGTGDSGIHWPIYFTEMLKYQVVIIVLGNETRDRLFKAVLKMAPYYEEAPPNQKILVIDAGLPGGKIPQCLQQFKSLNLEDVGILGQLQTAPESWGGSDHISFTDIINHVDVDAVLKLFCFMIEQTWPCL